MTRVWDLELPDSDKIVLLALADCANDEGHCWPSVASLVRKCSKSERTIQASIKRLVDHGLLLRREVFGKGCNYTVLPRTPAAAAPRNARTPAESAPPQGLRATPAAAADKPSMNHQTEAKASYTQIGELWNSLSPKSGIPEIKVWNNSRKQMASARIKEHGLPAILEGVRKIHSSPFCRGEIGDGRKQDIMLLLQAKTCARVLEGFYGEDGAAKLPQSIEDQIADLRKQIPFFENINRPHDAEDCRRRLSALEGPADPGVSAMTAGLVSGLAKNLREVAAR